MKNHSGSPLRLAVIGCGALGQTTVRACLEHRLTLKDRCLVVETNAEKRSKLEAEFGFPLLEGTGPALKQSEIIILVIKPQEAETVCQNLKNQLEEGQTVLSFMAGISVDKLREWLGGHAGIVRAMPNLPAKFGEGVSALYCPPGTGPEHLQRAQRIVNSFGQVIPVDSEDLVDAATALSATGPAYFFYIVEWLEATARDMGFDQDQARILARWTARGAGRMVSEESDSAEALRQRVTSKGGTTAAAFSVFDERGLGDTLSRGIRAAYRRARELSNGGK